MNKDHEERSARIVPPSERLNRILTPLFDMYSQKLIHTGWLATEESKAVFDRYTKKTTLVKSDTPRRRKKLGRIYRQASFGMTAQVESQDGNTDLHALVGDYGEQWTRDLTSAAGTLIEGGLMRTNPAAIHQEVVAITLNPADYNNLSKYTFLTRPDFIFAEGLSATLSAASILTAYQVPGYEGNPDMLLADLIDQHLISQLALTIAPTIIVKMASESRLFAPPVVIIDNNGKLKIRSDIVAHFVDETKPGGVYEHLSTNAAEPLERPGCPVARVLPDSRNIVSAIDETARLFLMCLRENRGTLNH